MKNLTIEKQSMERSHRVLEKKLHELEMRFTDLFFPPTNSINPADHQERLSKEIETRVDFLKNLLSIENACNQQGKVPLHLVRLEQRLDGFNAAFRDWMDGGEFVKKDIPMPGEFQVCSCTRSCFSSEEGEDEIVNGEEGEDERVNNEEEFKHEEKVEEEEKKKDIEEEGMEDMAESERFELEIKEHPTVLEVKESEIKEDPGVLEVKRNYEEKIDGDRKEQRGHHRPHFRLLIRTLAFVGGAAAVLIGVTFIVSDVFGGFQDDVFLVAT